MAVEKSIDKYINHFREHLNNLKSIEASEFTNINKQIISMSLIDALSISVYPNQRSNRKRVTRFVRKFFDWPEGDLISTTHLLAALNMSPEPCYAQLRNTVREKVMSWEYGSLKEIAEDYAPQEIDKLLKQGGAQAGRIGRYNIRRFAHESLLYEYRNGLVHECRRIGYGTDFAEGEKPHYHGMMKSPDENTWELVYPMKFIFRMCEECIENLMNYLHQEKIDPYNSYKFGSNWISEINQ